MQPESTLGVWASGRTPYCRSKSIGGVAAWTHQTSIALLFNLIRVRNLKFATYLKFATCENTKAESDLNFNYPINCSVKSTIFRLISYSVYSPAMPEIKLIQHPICTNK